MVSRDDRYGSFQDYFKTSLRLPLILLNTTSLSISAHIWSFFPDFAPDPEFLEEIGPAMVLIYTKKFRFDKNWKKERLILASLNMH